MKLSIKIMLAALLASAIVFSFGCGAGGDTDPSDTTAPADTTVPDTTAADTEPAETEPTVKPDPPAGEHEKIIFTDSFLRLDFTASNGESLPYCLYVPSNYSEEYAYPLVLFLHGAGVRGEDESNGDQLAEGVQGLFVPKNTPIYDAISVFPLCDSESRWAETDWALGNYSLDDLEISRNMSAVVELLDYIMEEYSINPNRQYVTGFSMGGFGTWDIIMRYPDRFAAAAPLCGGGDPSKAELLKDLPLWIAHDLDDDAVPVTASQDMVNALEDAGSTVYKYFETSGVGHNVWDPNYRNPEFQEWMFSQVKE